MDLNIGVVIGPVSAGTTFRACQKIDPVISEHPGFMWVNWDGAVIRDNSRAGSMLMGIDTPCTGDRCRPKLGCDFGVETFQEL